MQTVIMSIEQAARVFRVLEGRHIQPGDLESVSIEEAEKYIVLPTFEEFLERNRIKTYDEVIR